MGVVLFGLPLVAKYGLPSMLKNIFVLKGKYQVAIAMLGSAIAAGSVVITLHNIIDNAPARFNVPPTWLSDCPDLYYYVLAGILTVPTTWAVAVWTRQEIYANNAENESQKKKNPTCEITLGVVCGVGLEGIFTFVFVLIKNVLDQNKNKIGNLIISLKDYFDHLLKDYFDHFFSFLGKTVYSAGYIDPETHQLIPEHANGMVFFSILFALYVFFFCVYKPSLKPAKEKKEAPALLYILLLISIATLLLGILTFFFDYSRVSVLLFWILIAGSTYFVLNVDHRFTLQDVQNQEEEAPSFSYLLKKRLAYQGDQDKTLVVVCASGGGIQAAGWTAQVLMGLQQEIGESFTQAIGLISAVSGGSVGAIHYLDHFTKNGYPPNNPDEADRIFESATVNGLDAVGWGLTYPDLWRIIALPFLSRILAPIVGRQRMSDRGRALETEWRGEMKTPDTTLANWRNDVEQGTIPLPVLNATLIENGARFLLSPVNFPESEDKNSFSFNRLYPQKTIDIVTAARLSATFPYVTPIARADQDRDNNQTNYHVADGGYFDNSGFVTALEWLQEILQSPSSLLKFKKVIILQINPFPKENVTMPVGNAGTNTTNPPNKTGRGFLMTILGPLKGLFNVRDRVLNSRNTAEIELLKQWQNQATTQSVKEQDNKQDDKIEYIPIFFPSLTEEDGKNVEFYRNGEYEPPLSWKLTQSEKQAIRNGWEHIKDDPNILKIKAAFDKT